jgi:hypothetical protein
LANFTAQITNTASHLHSAFTVTDADTGKSYVHAQLIHSENKAEWLYSTANEFDRLTDDVKPHMLSGFKTMRYIPHHALPPGRQATYSRFVATEQPHKAKTKRVRLTVGGTKFAHPLPTYPPSRCYSTVSSPPKALYLPPST